MILIAVLVPWLLVRSLRFRYRNTSYRNLRFDFVGGVGQAYAIFGMFFALALLTVALPAGLGWLIGQQQGVVAGLGLGMLVLYLVIYPLFVHRLTTFTSAHSVYGDTCFTPVLKPQAYIGFFLGSIVVGLIGLILLLIPVMMMGAVFAQMDSVTTQHLVKFLPLFYVILVPAYFLPYAYWRVSTANYLLNNTRLGPVQFRSNLSFLHYWGILVSNAALVIITLGLAIPWAQVRMARYRVESVAYQGDLQDFVGSTLRDHGAAGEEIGDAFDIDLVGI
jgi:uncharacterized membrane protein YjgN (DUF898 family)